MQQPRLSGIFVANRSSRGPPMQPRLSGISAPNPLFAAAAGEEESDQGQDVPPPKPPKSFSPLLGAASIEERQSPLPLQSSLASQGPAADQAKPEQDDDLPPPPKPSKVPRAPIARLLSGEANPPTRSQHIQPASLRLNAFVELPTEMGSSSSNNNNSNNNSSVVEIQASRARTMSPHNHQATSPRQHKGLFSALFLSTSPPLSPNGEQPHLHHHHSQHQHQHQHASIPVEPVVATMVDGHRQVDSKHPPPSGQLIRVPFAREEFSGAESFMMYHIEVTLPANREPHVCLKRFSDFTVFHKEWKADFPQLSIAPPKRLLVVDLADVASRCVELESYLLACVAIRALTYRVAKFLHVNEEVFSNQALFGQATRSAEPVMEYTPAPSLELLRHGGSLGLGSVKAPRMPLPKLKAEADGSLRAIPSVVASPPPTVAPAAAPLASLSNPKIAVVSEPMKSPAPLKAKEIAARFASSSSKPTTNMFSNSSTGSQVKLQTGSTSMQHKSRGPPRPWPPPPMV